MQKIFLNLSKITKIVILLTNFVQIWILKIYKKKNQVYIFFRINGSSMNSYYE